jgi:transcription elongation factor Elf1
MFQCLHCQVVILNQQVEKDAGDWIIPCLYCGAKNILAPILINRIPPLPTIEIIGWRD